jgi:cytoskeleton protein RodZ
VAVTASTKSRVGKRLRLARVQRGVELEEAAKGTRITPRYLEALEHDAAPDAFPAPVYARAFLREYAQWLGIDPEPLVHSYVEAHPEPAPSVALPMPLQRPPARWVRRALTATSIAVLITLAVVSTRSGNPPRSAMPMFPSRLPSAAPATGAIGEPEPLPPGVFLTLRVVEEPCWARITSDGRVVTQMIAPPGFAETFTATRRLDLWLGNAGAVRLTVNGKHLSLPGENGAIYKVSFVQRGDGVRMVPYG